MTVDKLDTADWPPGAESGSGYYGVRVGLDIGVVDSPMGRIEQVAELAALGLIDVWQARELLGARPIPGNPWTRYGLNAREYGWHTPRSRA